MKQVLTGLGPDGRSSVLSVETVGEVPEPGGMEISKIWSTPSLPPDLGYVRPKTVDAVERDIGVPLGGASVMYASMGPGRTSPMHRTQTLDVVTIVAGSVELVLETGSVQMDPGDCVVMPAVVHSWSAGPEGCVISAMAIGVEAP